jgi:hypothetical protein
MACRLSLTQTRWVFCSFWKVELTLMGLFCGRIQQIYGIGAITSDDNDLIEEMKEIEAMLLLDSDDHAVRMYLLSNDLCFELAI